MLKLLQQLSPYQAPSTTLTLDPASHTSSMCDPFDLTPNCLHATYERDDPSPATLVRPTTPVPDGARTLRRTTSYASIETVRPSNSNKGVRRRINDIAENVKNKSAKKKKKDSSTHDVSKNATRDSGPDSKAKQPSKGTKRGRKAVAPLRDAPQRSEENVLVATDRLYNGTPSEDTPSTFLRCASVSLIDEALPKNDLPWENDLFSAGTFEPGADGQRTFQLLKMPEVETKDLQLDIRPYETDVTIWDGLQGPHHLFKFRLFLRCTTYPYNSVSIPAIRRFDVDCSTHPISTTHYARSPVLQSTYNGASLSLDKNTTRLPSMKLAAEIHVDRFWHTIQQDDGTWGWYRDAYVPLSPHLFDKMEYRRFKLVSRVWLGENCVESESTFGVSILLREVEMK